MVLCLWNSSTSLGVVILDTEATVVIYFCTGCGGQAKSCCVCLAEKQEENSILD